MRPSVVGMRFSPTFSEGKPPPLDVSPYNLLPGTNIVFSIDRLLVWNSMSVQHTIFIEKSDDHCLGGALVCSHFFGGRLPFGTH